jgi:hypothetical protein
VTSRRGALFGFVAGAGALLRVGGAPGKAGCAGGTTPGDADLGDAGRSGGAPDAGGRTEPGRVPGGAVPGRVPGGRNRQRW